MKFFNARVWLIIFGALGLLGGVVNAIGAESVALSEWGDLDGQALDIAIALEVAWGAILSVWGASVIVITLSLQRARGRARFRDHQTGQFLFHNSGGNQPQQRGIVRNLRV